MDSLLGTGGATASRLTLPQKIIASGMSLVLAFGLSPIGQAPAYADEAGAQPAGVELSTQASTVANWDVSWTDVTYTGAAQTPAFTVKDNKSTAGQSTTLELGVDYKISKIVDVNNAASPDYSATGVTDAGSYKVTLEGIGSYSGFYFVVGETKQGSTGVVTAPFVVNPLDLKTATVTASNTAYTYTGSSQNVDLGTITVKSGRTTLTPEYTITAGDSTVKEPTTAPLPYSVKLKDTKNFRNSTYDAGATTYDPSYKNIQLTVAKGFFKNATVTATALKIGSTADPYTVKFGDTPLVKDTDYTVTYYDDKGDATTNGKPYTAKAGTYRAVLKGKNTNRFDVTGGGTEANNVIETTYTVDDAEAIDASKITAAVVDTSQTYQYIPNGGEVTPKITYTYTKADGTTAYATALPSDYKVELTFKDATTGAAATPTAVGSYDVSVKVTDTNGKSSATLNATKTAKFAITARTVALAGSTLSASDVGKFVVTMDPSIAKDTAGNYTSVFAGEVDMLKPTVKFVSAYDTASQVATTIDVTDEFQVNYVMSGAHWNKTSDAGTYTMRLRFGTLSTSGTTTTLVPNSNYAGPVGIGTYVVTPYSLAGKSLAFAPLTYNGGEQAAPINNAAFGGSTDAALSDDVLKKQLEAGNLAVTYGAAENGGSYGGTGLPLTAGTYVVNLAPGTTVANYSGSINGAVLTIGALTDLSGYKVQFQDPITSEWVDSGELRVALSGSAMTPAFRVVSNDGKQKLDDNSSLTNFTAKFEGNTAVGTATLTLTPKGANVTASTPMTASFEITGKSLVAENVKIVVPSTNAIITAFTSQPYDGVKDYIPVFGTDYAVRAQGTDTVWNDVNTTFYKTQVVDSTGNVVTNCVNAGTYTLQVVGQGDYSGTISATLTVTRVNVPNTALTAPSATVTGYFLTTDATKLEGKGIEILSPSLTYTGEEQVWNPTVYFNGKTLVAGADYKISNNKQTNASKFTTGTTPTVVPYTAVIEFQDSSTPAKFGTNFSGTINPQFVIAKAKQTVTVDPEVMNLGIGEVKAIKATSSVKGATFTYASTSPTVATVATDGKVTGIAYGLTTVTVTATDPSMSPNFEDTTASVVVKVKLPQTVTAPANMSVVYGETKAIEGVSGTGEITYKSSDEKVATVDKDGKVTAVAAGTATITVSAAGNDDYAPGTANIKLTVEKAAQTVTAADVELTYKGEAKSIEAKSNVEGAKFTYKSADEKVATVDADGKVTPVAVGETTVTVTAAGTDNYKEGVKDVKVTVAKAEQEMAAEDVETTFGFVDVKVAATALDEAVITYAADNSGVVEVNAETGALTILKAGEAVVTATAAETANYKQGTKEIKVTVAKAEQTITAEPVTVAVDATATAIAEASGKGKISFAEDNSGTYKLTGDKVTGVKAGAGKINVTAAETENYKAAEAQIDVTVSQGVQVITAKDVAVYAGEFAKIEATSTDAAAKFTYLVADESIATVTEDGIVTGVKAGKTSIMVIAAADENYQENYEIIQVVVTGKTDNVVEATIDKDIIAYGETAQITAKATAGAITYESADTTVASVDANGKVTAKYPGKTYIVVSAAGDATHDAGVQMIPVAVIKAAQTVTATPATITIYADATAKVEASTDGLGSLRFTSNDTSVATVADDGTVKGIGGGTAYVNVVAEATELYNEGTATVAVTVNKLANVVKFDKDALELAYGEAGQLAATGEGAVTYASSDINVAVVSANGAVLAVAPGTATITATAAGDAKYESGTATATVTVVKADSGMTVKAKNVKAKSKKKTKVKASKVWTVAIAEGATAPTFAKVDGNAKIKVKANGKVVVKKGLKAGTYKVSVTATSAENDLYNEASQDVVLKVKVK